MYNVEIISIFFFTLLVICLLPNNKATTVKDYTIANKKVSNFALSLTKAATSIGGGLTIGAIATFYKTGFVFLSLYIGTVISYKLFNKHIAPKFDSRFKDKLSMGDIIEMFFGHKISKFCSIVIYISSIGVLTAQFTALGYILSNFLAIDYKYAVFLCSSAIIIYTTFGGVKSVITTDILQFLIFIIVIPIVTIVTIKEFGLQTITNNLPDFYTSKPILIIEAVLLFIISAIPRLTPTNCHRYLIAKDYKQIIRVNKIYLYLFFIITICTMILGFTAYSLVGLDINPNTILLDISKQILPQWCYPIVIIALLCIIMSTADSFLNTQSIIFVRNILPSSKWSESKELLIMKLVSALTGIVTIFFALQKFDILNTLILVRSLSQAWTSIPLIIVLAGIKTFKNNYWSCVVFGTIGYMIAIAAFPTVKYCDSFLTISCSILGFFFVMPYNKRKSIRKAI